MLTFRVLSALLQYPSRDILAHRDEMAVVLREEGLLPAQQRQAVEAFVDHLSGRDLMDLEAEYVETFDRTRALSLHLFEHIHGESRDRGQAMVDLAEHYRRSGLELTSSELPDYLPLFLEFLATRPVDEARAFLGETVNIVASIGKGLEKRGSPYAPVVAAVVALSAVTPDPAVIEARKRAGEEPAIADADWEEPPVMFGAADAPGRESGSCPRAKGAVARMRAGH